MEFNDWVKYAERYNYLLRPCDLKKLQVGNKYYIIRIDYIGKHSFKPNIIYKPEELFSNYRDYIIPTGKLEILRDPEPRYCFPIDKLKKYGVIMGQYDFKNPSHDILYERSRSNWLATGIGESYTRWMLWNNLLHMPDLYFKKK